MLIKGSCVFYTLPLHSSDASLRSHPSRAFFPHKFTLYESFPGFQHVLLCATRRPYRCPNHTSSSSPVHKKSDVMRRYYEACAYLSSVGSPPETCWAELREAQLNVCLEKRLTSPPSAGAPPSPTTGAVTLWPALVLISAITGQLESIDPWMALKEEKETTLIN